MQVSNQKRNKNVEKMEDLKGRGEQGDVKPLEGELVLANSRLVVYATT